jgi:hypothetical protein
MKRATVRGLVITPAIIGLNHQALTQQQDIGKAEYIFVCAACHGADGKGAGPMADALKTKPADLTTITKRNHGVFPLNRIYETIDGRAEVKLHGSRDMPIWGYRYTPSLLCNDFPVLCKEYSDPVFDPQTVATRRMLALIDYLYRLQEK